MSSTLVSEEPKHRSMDPNIAGDGWFCVRTQPKHEHIAAAHLKRAEIDVFHPRIRFVRSTRRGPVTFTESLFPNYLFARFDWRLSLNLVHYMTGVVGVVHFGSHWPTIPHETVEELRNLFAHDSIRDIPTVPDVGETVIIGSGVFEGLEAVVTRVMPGPQRVAVLLDFLGRQTTLEVPTSELVRNNFDRVVKELKFAL